MENREREGGSLGTFSTSVVCQCQDFKVREGAAFSASSVSDCCPVSLPGSFVSDVVHIYYTSDEAVQADEEIQAFIKDVCSFGMQDFDHCGGCT